MLPEEDQGLVLMVRETKERFWSVAFFSPNRGLYFPLIRRSKKWCPPDIFDTANARISQAKQGDLNFLSEYEPIRRRTSIARSYQRFRIASRFADVLRRNAQHFPDSSTAFQASERLFDSLEQSPAPEAAYLKTIYLLAKTEGLPVREHWVDGLGEPMKSDLQNIISSPLDQQSDDPDMFRTLTASLEKWMEGEAHFQIPPGNI
tara:strand:- start:254 stop:865 length:612 start_codon:yes stop_codon:yes gene_type:complete